ncbi:hypothetical protein UA3_02576 [Enterococcus faecium EnGen0263]|uniref:hypothetical protein n=1 Tax=Enterococcus faecium TaxID=1352 RepID=UPI00032D84E4|nr:hypothetical protein [Enterococcus faecium]EOH52450.1 hypothetical protein UA3_02576 [Enterococcus faecium EnGen0263]
MKNKQSLTSLMKKKFGVTRSSSLKITEKDTLHTIFRKLAIYIYKNGVWTEEDHLAAVETMVRNRENFILGMSENEAQTVRVHMSTPEERFELGTKRIQSFLPYTAVINRQTEKGTKKELRYVLLDENNTVGKKHNCYWWLEKSSSNHKEEKIKKIYGYGDLKRAIGYDKLIRDLVKTFQEKELNKQEIALDDLQRFLHVAIDTTYSSKKWSYLFMKSYWGELSDEQVSKLPRDESPRYWAIPTELQEDFDSKAENYYHFFNWRDLSIDPSSRNKLNLDEAPYLISTPDGAYSISPQKLERSRKYNALINFIQDYVEDSYDAILQQEYEKSIDKMTRASAWQTKKNINKETHDVMLETKLNRCFNLVEIDNDVDLELFHKFEDEMEEVFYVLPQVVNSPDLRLRKLGNYHALGLYHALSNTITIDFRGPEDQRNINYVPKENGINSFIHEYGHFLDYNFREDGQLMSMNPDFKTIVTKYRENIQRLGPESLVKKRSEYYGTPTEIFARAFEIYSSQLRLHSSLIKQPECYNTQEEYQCFDAFLREQLTTYFDQTFPDYLEKINEFHENRQKIGDELTVPAFTKEQVCFNTDFEFSKKSKKSVQKNMEETEEIVM